MNGRFGKKMLVSTLRGSAAKQVLTAKLNELSTYGLLKDMAGDAVEAYVDALVERGCLKVKGGAYPTISTTELGDRVMREQEQVELAL
jgi:ATP-dependent DNA helicase RecQ